MLKISYTLARGPMLQPIELIVKSSTGSQPKRLSLYCKPMNYKKKNF